MINAWTPKNRRAPSAGARLTRTASVGESRAFASGRQSKSKTTTATRETKWASEPYAPTDVLTAAGLFVLSLALLRVLYEQVVQNVMGVFGG